MVLVKRGASISKLAYVALALLVLLLMSGFSLASSMTLLAVSKVNDTLVGTQASLELDIKPGSGKVFISTNPLTNVDTQISFRMAKEFACDYLDKDCGSLDFYYQIESSAPIIGGPSAGGAATALTIAELNNHKPLPDVAATGTINSGGVIGPVAGVKQKIEAAAHVGIKKVMIPSGTRYTTEDNMEEAFINLTSEVTGEEYNAMIPGKLDLVEYGKSLGIDVIEVSEISEMVSILTGKPYMPDETKVSMADFYEGEMMNISTNLCQRTLDLKDMIPAKTAKEFPDELEEAENLTLVGAESYHVKQYYAAASYCYGANVIYNKILIYSKNLTSEQMEQRIYGIGRDLDAIQDATDAINISTVNDLQTKLVVNERIEEARIYADEAREALQISPELAISPLALSIERLYSAKYWSSFFGHGGKQFDLSDSKLERLCIEKMAEADERIEYVKTFFPLPLTALTDELAQAGYSSDKKDYSTCIFKASKVKARANLLISAIGIDDASFQNMLDKKIDIAGRAIAKETSREVFPILGYSYYEYAYSLRDTDPSSSMLYAELALELSNFDMYFEQESYKHQITLPRLDGWVIFAGGALLGLGLSMLIISLSIGASRTRQTKTNNNPGKKPRIKSRKQGSRRKIV